VKIKYIALKLFLSIDSKSSVHIGWNIVFIVCSRLSNFSPLQATGLHLDICLALIAFSSEVSFSCQHPQHGTSVYTVSSKGPAPTVEFEPGTQGSLDRSDHCTTQVATLFCFDIHSHTPRNAVQMRHTTTSENTSYKSFRHFFFLVISLISWWLLAFH
jgi:hypothetical protein